MNREAVLTEAAALGSQAYRDSQPFETCPHPHGSYEGNAWRNGWLAAQRLERVRIAAVPEFLDELERAADAALAGAA